MDAAARNPRGGGEPFPFYSEDEQGNPVITAPEPMTPDAASSFVEWQAAVPADTVMSSLREAVATGWDAGGRQAQGMEGVG